MKTLTPPAVEEVALPVESKNRLLFVFAAAAATFGYLLSRILLIRKDFGLGSDETVYVLQAMKWLGRVQQDALIADFRPRGVGATLLPMLAPSSPPTLYHRLVYSLIGLALVWVVYFIGRRMVGRWPAAWGAAIFSVFWIHVFTSVQFLPDVMASLLASVGYLIYIDRVIDAPDDDERPLWPVTVLVAATFYFNSVHAFFALAVIGVHYVVSKRSTMFTRRALIAAVAAALVLLPYFVRVWMDHGTPFALLQELVGIHRHKLSRVRQPIGYDTYPLWFFDKNWLFGRVGGWVVIAATISLLATLVRGRPVVRRHAAFVLLWLVIPSVGMAVVTHAEERYLYIAYPALALTVAVLARTLTSFGGRRTRIAIGIGLASLLPIYGVTQYAIAEARTQRYNKFYLFRDYTTRVVGEAVERPCRVYGFHPELAQINVPCTYVNYVRESPQGAAAKARAFSGRTYFVVPDVLPAGDRFTWVEQFLEDHARRVLYLPRDAAGGGNSLYVFTR